MVLNAGQNVLRRLSRTRRVLALAPSRRRGGGGRRAAHSLVGRGCPLELRMILAELVDESESEGVRRHMLCGSIRVGERSGGPQPVGAQRVDRRRQMEVRTPLLQVEAAFCLRSVAAEHVPNAGRVLVRRRRSRLRAHEGHGRTVVAAQREGRLPADSGRSAQSMGTATAVRDENSNDTEVCEMNAGVIQQGCWACELAGWLAGRKASVCHRCVQRGAVSDLRRAGRVLLRRRLRDGSLRSSSLSISILVLLVILLLLLWRLQLVALRVGCGRGSGRR